MKYFKKSLLLPALLLALGLTTVGFTETVHAQVTCNDGTEVATEAQCNIGSRGGVRNVSVTNDGFVDSACRGITGNPDCGDAGFFNNFVASVTSLLIFIVGGISAIMIVVGGIRYVVSGGDSNAVNGAKNTIMYAIIGLVVSAAAFLIVRFVIGRL